MKKALILGISGGFGGHMAQALARRGYAIKALMRDTSKLPSQFKGAEVIQGDAANIEHVRNAAKGVELLVYGVNAANYRWDGVALPLLETSAQVAEEQKLTLLFPGNVYVFDPADGPVFTEASPMKSVSSKGDIRIAMEQRLQRASENGAQVIILRMGDFIGSGAPSTWLGHLIKGAKQTYSLATTGPRDLSHTWAFLPDASRTFTDLVQIKEDLAAFNVFHFRGYESSFEDMADAIQQASGKKVKLGSFPWFVLRLLAPFNATFHGLVEMRYLWNKEVKLSQDKLEKTLAKSIPHTPLSQALLESGILGNL